MVDKGVVEAATHSQGVPLEVLWRQHLLECPQRHWRDSRVAGCGGKTVTAVPWT